MTMWQNNDSRYVFSGSGENTTPRCACTKWKPNDTIMCYINTGCSTVQTEKKVGELTHYVTHGND